MIMMINIYEIVKVTWKHFWEKYQRQVSKKAQPIPLQYGQCGKGRKSMMHGMLMA